VVYDAGKQKEAALEDEEVYVYYYESTHLLDSEMWSKISLFSSYLRLHANSTQPFGVLWHPCIWTRTLIVTHLSAACSIGVDSGASMIAFYEPIVCTVSTCLSMCLCRVLNVIRYYAMQYGLLVR
jgi:hypothetical protein